MVVLISDKPSILLAWTQPGRGCTIPDLLIYLLNFYYGQIFANVDKIVNKHSTLLNILCPPIELAFPLLLCI